MVELRSPQVAILKCLVEYNTPMSRKQISAICGVELSKIGDYAGPRPTNQSDKTKARWQFPTLVELRLVRVEQHDIDGIDVQVYFPTSEGRKFLESRSTEDATNS